MNGDFNRTGLPPLQLWLARHGSNVKDEELAGAVPLSEQGREEVNRMAAFLAGQPISYPLLIITAGLTRNLETSDIIEDRLSSQGNVQSVRADALINKDPETFLNIFLFILGLDVPKNAGLDMDPPRSLLVIGNKQNLLVELLSIAFDPVTEILKIIKDPKLIEGMDNLQIADLILNDNADAFLDNDRDLELFSKARLVGLQLFESEWARIRSGGKRICDRAFAFDEEKAYLKDWQP